MAGAAAPDREVTKTVLMVDMVGSTQLLAELGPDRADAVRRALFSIFGEETAAAGGQMVKTTGDGCLSTFSSAATAIEAALAMHRAASRLGRRLVPVQLRIGIAVGDVTSDDGDIFGMPVVIAARLCDRAGHGQVLVSQTVVDVAGDRGGHRYRDAGALELKGIPNPVLACEVVPAATEVQAPLPTSLGWRTGEVLVGREREHTALRGAWKEVTSGEGPPLALVHGEAGVGKSRLVAALAREVHADGAVVLLGRCEPGRHVSFEPVQAPLRALIETADRSVLRSHVAASGGELLRIAPELASRLDHVPDPETGDPGVERDRLFGAVSDLLARCAREAPILFVVEDIHWASRSTLQILDHLTGQAAPDSVLTVATFRDARLDKTPELDALLAEVTSREGALRVALGGLGEDELRAMVSTLGGDELDELDPEVVSFVRSLHERTGGNPFFTVQVLRHLVERGELFQDGGRWRASDRAGLDLPSGVVEVVGQRVALLPAGAREVLTVAAVVGDRFTLADLRRVMSSDLAELVASLESAAGVGLLRDAGPGAFSFIHAIVRETMLAEMSSTARAMVHLRIADACAGIGVADGGPDLRIIAEHYLQAAVLGDARPAGRFALEAAATSLWQTDHDGARSMLERAAAAVESVGPVDWPLLHDLLVTLLRVLLSQLDPDFRQVVPRAAEAARRTRDPARLAAVALCVTGMSNAGEPDPETTGLLEEALEGLGPSDDAVRAYVLASLGFGELLEGRAVGTARVDEALEIAERLAGTDDEILAQVRVLAGFASVGRPGAAARLRSVEAAMEACPAGGDWRSGLREKVPLSMVPVLGPEVRGLAQLACGDRAAFERSFEDMCEIAERTGTSLALGWSIQWRTMLALLDGRFDEAPQLGYAAVEAIPSEANYALGYQAQLLWQAIEQGNAGHTVEMLRIVADTTPSIPAFRALLAVGLLQAGDSPSARSEAERTLAGFADSARNWLWPQTPFQLAEVVCVLGMTDAVRLLLDELDPYAGELLVVGPGVYAAGAFDRSRGMLRSLAGEHDEAIDCLRQGLRLEERIGSPPLAARSRYWLARALLARSSGGDSEEAGALVRHSCDVASGLGMAALVADLDALRT